MGEYVKKGSKIYIEGRLQTSSWDDKESGQKRYKTEIIASDLVLLGGRGDGEAAGRGRSGGEHDQRTPEPDHSQAAQITDEDIPF